ARRRGLPAVDVLVLGNELGEQVYELAGRLRTGRVVRDDAAARDEGEVLADAHHVEVLGRQRGPLVHPRRLGRSARAREDWDHRALLRKLRTKRPAREKRRVVRPSHWLTRAC